MLHIQTKAETQSLTHLCQLDLPFSVNGTSPLKQFTIIKWHINEAYHYPPPPPEIVSALKYALIIIIMLENDMSNIPINLLTQ